MAVEFGIPTVQMANACLDACLAYMRAALLEGANAVGFLPLPPVANAGWSELSDSPEEWVCYDGVCARLRQVLDVPLVRLEPEPFTIEQILGADSSEAVARVVAAMTSHQIPFVPEHWPLGNLVSA